MAFRTSREHFEGLVERALRALPAKYRGYFKNLTVMVEDYPTREEAIDLDIPEEELLGMFRGAGYPGKGGFFEVPPPLPDTIVLYQKNIEALCSSEEDLLDEIRITLVHEVGHYFGLSEEDLEKYE